MATFGTIQTNVSKRLLDPSNTSVSQSDVAAAINDATRYWKFRRFWFNEVSDTATMTEHDPDFPYPDDFLVPAFGDDGFCIEYSGIRYPLQKVTSQVYDGMFLTNGYGMPQFYARQADNEYQAYPIPDRDYTVRRHYLKDYADLENTQDTNDFTTYAPRLLTLWSLANLFAEFRQDPEMETYYRKAAMDEYRQLQVMTDKANGTGRLVIHSRL